MSEKGQLVPRKRVSRYDKLLSVAHRCSTLHETRERKLLRAFAIHFSPPIRETRILSCKRSPPRNFLLKKSSNIPIERKQPSCPLRETPRNLFLEAKKLLLPRQRCWKKGKPRKEFTFFLLSSFFFLSSSLFERRSVGAKNQCILFVLLRFRRVSSRACVGWIDVCLAERETGRIRRADRMINWRRL